MKVAWGSWIRRIHGSLYRWIYLVGYQLPLIYNEAHSTKDNKWTIGASPSDVWFSTIQDISRSTTLIEAGVSSRNQRG